MTDSSSDARRDQRDADFQQQVLERFDKLETRVDKLGTDVDQIGTRVDQLTTNVDQLGTRVDQLGTRVDQLTTDVDKLTTGIGRFNDRFSDYQQATQWVVQLAFTLIASATLTVIVTSVLRR